MVGTKSRTSHAACSYSRLSVSTQIQPTNQPTPKLDAVFTDFEAILLCCHVLLRINIVRASPQPLVDLQGREERSCDVIFSPILHSSTVSAYRRASPHTEVRSAVEKHETRYLNVTLNICTESRCCSSEKANNVPQYEFQFRLQPVEGRIGSLETASRIRLSVLTAGEVRT